LEFSLRGDLIQPDLYNQLDFVAYACKADENALSQQIGDAIGYDFSWNARHDPTEGKVCQFTLTNTVPSYA
jgi:hypothetical protein